MKFISLTWIHLQQDGFISLMGYFYFLYQTFDAVDRKQARRTNSSSPLEELFDHGCDALACAVHVFNLLRCMTKANGIPHYIRFDSFRSLKPWPLGALLCVEGTVSGSGYFTNTLILPVDNGPTEGLALIYVMHFLIGFLLSFLCLKRGRQKEKYLCCLLALLDLIF
ncbi:choline/ethanolaminephosphotransferase 1 isoform X1 [Gossypium hirsutum]|uniref:Choline/ethanolaminephosphotransferase 1 isoform X1 n=2 Tax=Gossypium TaxID=3633 RepID=A0ABM3AB85_GOSHI|nr:choline/ethanolaminephosphotransferase 1 isoform X1 [Gossypium hirsutum]